MNSCPPHIRKSLRPPAAELHGVSSKPPRIRKPLRPPAGGSLHGVSSKPPRIRKPLQRTAGGNFQGAISKPSHYGSRKPGPAIAKQAPGRIGAYAPSVRAHRICQRCKQICASARRGCFQRPPPRYPLVSQALPFTQSCITPGLLAKVEIAKPVAPARLPDRGKQEPGKRRPA